MCCACRFDLRQHKTSTADWEAALERAVRKRVEHSAPRARVWLALSSGYDSGAVHLALSRQGLAHRTWTVTALPLLLSPSIQCSFELPGSMARHEDVRHTA